MKELQEQIKALSTADKVAFKAGTKSNFVLDFVRNELIKRAFEMDENLKKDVEIELNMTIASIITPSVALLTKEGNYPNLLSKAEFAFKNGEIVLSYKINHKGVSNEYREILNTKLNIQIPQV